MVMVLSKELAGAPCWQPVPHIEMTGWRIATSSRSELTEAFVADCRNRRDGQRLRLVFDINGHAVALAATNPLYRLAIEAGDIIHADGGYLVFLSRWLATARIKERSGLIGTEES